MSRDEGKKMNNPQAFPRPHSVDDVDGDISYPAHAGMTLRDYFAAKAMHVLLSHPEFDEDVDDTIATASYHIADAMLKAREQ